MGSKFFLIDNSIALMIRRPSYRQFLGNNVQSSVNLSFNDRKSTRQATHGLSPSYLASQMQSDQKSFLDLIKRIPDDPRTLRHSCANHTNSKSNLNSSFTNAHPTVSPKKVGQSNPTKTTRPASSFRPTSRQQPKPSIYGLSSRLELTSCLALKPENSGFPGQLQNKMTYQSKSNTKLLKLGDEQIEREIEKLKELRQKRIQNNANIIYRFQDKFKTDIEQRIPRSAINLGNSYNKENKGRQCPNLNSSFQTKEKSITPVKTATIQPDPSIFMPIQFRKKSSNQGLVQNKIVEQLSKSPIKIEPILTTTTLKPQPSLFSTFSINEAPKPQRQREKKLSLSDFALGKKLGEGRFGSVSMAIHKVTGSIFALKKISKSTIRQNFLIQQFILQVKIQLFIEHSYVVKLFGLFDDEDNIYLLLEYLEGGTLYSQLKRKSKCKMTEEETSVRMGMICEAINCLHQKGIAHRDIKPQNIIITNDICKLADFGWATLCDERRKTYCGTTDYVAPQIVEGLQYDISVDLWCVGVLAYELLAGRAPFYHISRQETFNKIKNVDSSSLSYPQHFSQEAIDFIGRLIKKNPNERMEMSEAVQHPLITKYHF